MAEMCGSSEGRELAREELAILKDPSNVSQVESQVGVESWRVSGAGKSRNLRGFHGARCSRRAAVPGRVDGSLDRATCEPKLCFLVRSRCSMPTSLSHACDATRSISNLKPFATPDLNVDASKRRSSKVLRSSAFLSCPTSGRRPRTWTMPNRRWSCTIRRTQLSVRAG